MPAIASTLPRARERGPKAYLRDGEARKATLIDPKGPANRGSNTAAAIASTPARTSKKLSISPTSSNVTYYSADEMMLRNTILHIKGEKIVPGFASTLPRGARERGAKAYLRDGEANNQPI